MNIQKGDMLICAFCGEEFETTWGHEEAQKEKEKIWGKTPGKYEIVCDPCFKRLMKYKKG